jgi:hypothetical protein
MGEHEIFLREGFEPLQHKNNLHATSECGGGGGGEPLCVFASDRQLHDLNRFCCDETGFKLFTVDPTFNIGQFNVSPISYQYLLHNTVITYPRCVDTYTIN